MELSGISAGSLFFGAVLYLVRKHEPELIERIVLAIGGKWRHLDFVARMLA